MLSKWCHNVIWCEKWAFLKPHSCVNRHVLYVLYILQVELFFLLSGSFHLEDIIKNINTKILADDLWQVSFNLNIMTCSLPPRLKVVTTIWTKWKSGNIVRKTYLQAHCASWVIQLDFEPRIKILLCQTQTTSNFWEQQIAVTFYEHICAPLRISVFKDSLNSIQYWALCGEHCSLEGQLEALVFEVTPSKKCSVYSLERHGSRVCIFWGAIPLAHSNMHK